MTTRTKQLLQRSRDLLERSRVAAVQFLDPPRGTTTALPRVIEGSRESMIHQEPEGAVVDICASIALRDLNLVDSLLSLLERMEETEADPDRLTELYKLDHLAARLRRNAENLRVLAGRDASDAVSDSASLVDVIRAAMSSIDGYSRVSIGRVLALGVVGIAADDLSRLLAELLDNAAKQSPPDTPVRVSAYLTDSGSVLMRIEDDGIGLPAERVAELNSRLSDEPKLNDDSVRHMGLAVVRRLASRHDMRVRLDRRSPHGTTATVLLPSALVCELPGDAWSGSQTVVRSAARHAAEAESVPEVRRAAPRPRQAAEQTATTAGGLPKRNPTGGRVATRPQRPQDLTEQGRTVNGLPRRVSRSIKSPDHGDDAPGRSAPPATPAEERAGHEQLLADLDAFAEGEQAAKEAAWPDAADAAATEPATGLSTADAADVTVADRVADRHAADVAGEASAADPRTAGAAGAATVADRHAADVSAEGPAADPRTAGAAGAARVADRHASDVVGEASAADLRTAGTAGAARVADRHASDVVGEAAAADPRTPGTAGAATVADRHASDVVGEAQVADPRTAGAPGAATVADRHAADVSAEGPGTTDVTAAGGTADPRTTDTGPATIADREATDVTGAGSAADGDASSSTDASLDTDRAWAPIGGRSGDPAVESAESESAESESAESRTTDAPNPLTDPRAADAIAAESQPAEPVAGPEVAQPGSAHRADKPEALASAPEVFPPNQAAEADAAAEETAGYENEPRHRAEHQERYPSEPLGFEPLRPAEPVDGGYAPDSMFDASADTPTPPHGFEMPRHEPDRGRDQQPGGATP